MLKRPEWNDGRVNLRALQAKRNQPFDDRGRELPFDDAKHLCLGRRRPLAEPIAHLHIGDVHPESLNYIMPYPLRQNVRSEEHTSELQSLRHLVCRLLL